MARPKGKESVSTVFGQSIDAAGLSYAQVAQQLGVSAPYVGMLARGETTPALALAFEICDWAKSLRIGEVPVESWKQYCK